MAEADRIPQLIDRFRRLPVLAREVWQGGVALMPAWITPEDGTESFRPYAAVWVSVSTGRIDVHLEPARNTDRHQLLLTGLLRFARKEAKAAHGRAARLQVTDAETREHLERAIGDTATHVELVPKLDLFDEALREYTRLVKEDSDLPPSMLDVPGVTLDVVRGFAEAAAIYYRAAPWQYLSDDDLIEVESPDAPAGYRFALVLGNAGHTFGLAFYSSPAQHDAMRNVDSPEAAARVMDVARSILFDSADGIPFDDHDLWLDHRLPLAGPRAYPFAAHYAGPHHSERPGRNELEFAEGVLRALADTTEDEMDSARWTKTVVAGGRSVSVRLSLPGLLDPGKPGSSTASTPAERAQELAYQAYDWLGRKRVVLAKQALALWPDCAEAYIILAEHAPTAERALPLYERAVEAGRRAVGDAFDGLAGEMWGHVDARPYMRARMELAQTLLALDRPGEAIAHFQDLLRLNENDNQGVRDVLVPLLLEHGRLAETEAILLEYRDDAGATLAYCAALLAYRKEGDSDTSRAALAAALACNRFVAGFLREPPLTNVDRYQLGSEDEAAVVAELMSGAWHATPGALEWAERTARAIRADKRATARRRAKKAKGRRR